MRVMILKFVDYWNVYFSCACELELTRAIVVLKSVQFDARSKDEVYN